MSRPFFNWHADAETAATCLVLIDRAMQRITKSGQVVASGGYKKKMRQTVVRRMPKRAKYGKHNPMPADVRARVVARLREQGARKASFVQIGAEFGVSHCVVGDIARSVGIHRTKGNWRLVA